MKRDILALSDLTADELTSVVALAARLKKGGRGAEHRADLRIQESLGTWQGKIVAWVGDGNNVANAWIDAAGLLGFELRVACPEGYEPDRKLFERNAARTRVTITEEPEEAVAGADVVSTDVWTSMGQEENAEQRRKAFEGYTVTTELMDGAAPGAIFLHCLPAHRGEKD